MGYISLLNFHLCILQEGVIDMVMGFGIVNVMDTQSNTPIPLWQFFYIIATLIFNREWTRLNSMSGRKFQDRTNRKSNFWFGFIASYSVRLVIC